jgi:hypothetical protein
MGIMVRTTSLISALCVLQLVNVPSHLALCSGGPLRFLNVDGFLMSVSQRSKASSSPLVYQQRFALRTSRHEIPIDSDVLEIETYNMSSRRELMLQARGFSLGAVLSLVYSSSSVASEASLLDTIRAEIQRARNQMNAIPDLIQSEQWDSVRAILIAPPLSDLWTKSSRKTPLLVEYATAIGETPSGDELAVLEAKEDLSSHLRFLDMAAYNNNFNPIKSMGETGATKELIRSYYDDPTNEFKASVVALEELIQLGKVH